MRHSLAVVVALVCLMADDALGQRPRVTVSGGDVTSSHSRRRDSSRLAATTPLLTAELRTRLRVTADSAQRIALDDFEWRGRVSSVAADEEDSRLFWDVRIVPDTSRSTILRYRIDAVNGGILEIREFIGTRDRAQRPPH